MLSEEGLVQRLSDLLGAEHVKVGEDTFAYAVDGMVPRAVAFPASVRDISSIMAFASAEGLKVVPRGSGTKMGLGGVPEDIHLVLSLSRLNGVVDHEPADMTATFQAGILLKEAQTILDRNRQFIPLDPPYGEAATIGGILATNSSGPKRLRYGASRDLVLAIRVVHADGKVTKGGAKVVKNVSGYDMNKLYIGSLGTLAIIVEATFRLYPVTAFEKSYLVPFASIDAAWAVVARILNSPVVPSAIELLNPEASRHIAEQADLPWPKGCYGLVVAVGSVHREAVNAQLGMVRRFCGEASMPEGQLLNSQVHETFWRVSRDLKLADSPQAVLKASVPLTKVAEGVRLGEEVAAKQGLGLGVVSEAGSGIIRYYLTGEAASPGPFQQGVVETVKQLRAFAQEAKGSLVVLEAPREVKGRVDVWGPVGRALPLMQALKDQFDPERILNPGRFVGGI
ncbi:MAG: FAD-binding oxidoreductase [Candidatus Binatia bacterium]